MAASLSPKSSNPSWAKRKSKPLPPEPRDCNTLQRRCLIDATFVLSLCNVFAAKCNVFAAKCNECATVLQDVASFYNVLQHSFMGLVLFCVGSWLGTSVCVGAFCETPTVQCFAKRPMSPDETPTSPNETPTMECNVGAFCETPHVAERNAPCRRTERPTSPNETPDGWSVWLVGRKGGKGKKNRECSVKALQWCC